MTSNLVRTEDWDTRWVSAVINYKGSEVGHSSFAVTGDAGIDSEFEGTVSGSGEEGFELHIAIVGADRPTTAKPYVITLPATMKVNSYGASEATFTYTGSVESLTGVTEDDCDVSVTFTTLTFEPALPDGEYDLNVDGSISGTWYSDNGLAVSGTIFDTPVDNEIGNNTPIEGMLLLPYPAATIMVSDGTFSMPVISTTCSVSVEGDTISATGTVTDVTVDDITYKTDTDTYTR